MSGFVSVRCVGGALPADVLSAVVGGDQLKGLSADDYHLEFGVSPREAANRAWSVLTGAWAGYRDAITRLGDNDRAVGMTREKWLGVVLRELGFGRVPLSPTGGLTADGRTFPVSHVYDLTVGHVPLHLLGWGVTLDQKTAGQPGAADRAPHAMVQEYLNRSEQALWGIVTNGRTLRLLRDSSTLIGQSYVEFDLEAMFDGDVFSDFVVFFLLCHVTRFEPDRRDDASPADCWLERWRTYAAETGTRALQALSPGVKQAIEAIGTGILRHPANTLHHRLADNTVTAKDLHEALLRLVYRLLFCFVAEDRGLLLDPNAPPLAKQRYTNWFSTSRLRKIATRRRGSAHPDLWQALSVVLDGLGTEGGRPELGLPGLGGLFDTGPADVVIGCQLANEPLLNAIRHLTIVQPAGGGPKRVVDYRNLGAEELGSVYESLLEYVPRYDPHTRTLTLETTPGNDRKTSGAYYTPSSLIDCLLGTALDPLLDQAERADDPETALLELTICDPACGSGHFLVAAARRIAARLAAVRARRDSDGGGEPTVLDEQRAMHDVVDRCIYGVDLNPMAAELAKVSLWLESVQPGRALSFLNAHIKVGNALLGTTPNLLTQGIPDTAYTPLDGDDKKLATSLKKRNAHEEAGNNSLFGATNLNIASGDFGAAAREVDVLPNMSLADVQLATRRFVEFDASPALRRARAIADIWCAAFLQPKVPGTASITTGVLRGVADGSGLDSITETAVHEISARYRCFHWHLEFPQVFLHGQSSARLDGPGWDGGFTCVVGNPPFISPVAASGAKVSHARNLTKCVRRASGGPKADESSYFLLLASDLIQAGGRVGVVLPDSFLSAADSAPIRAAIGERHDLTTIWRGDGSEFEAAVTTIILSLAPRDTCKRPVRLVGPNFEPVGDDADVPWRTGSWSPLVASGEAGVGVLLERPDKTMGELCSVVADYRDQYYGLRGAVYDAPPGDADVSLDPALITTGLIDPLRCLWGTTSTKFDKTTYERPRVRVASLEPNLQRWAHSRMVPKLLVATQGTMVEAIIDHVGELLPSVPVISVVPNPDSGVPLTQLAAIFMSPAAFEYFRMTKAGSGLSTEAIKVSAADLRLLPAPSNFDAVAEASDLLGQLNDEASRTRFRTLMNDAYGLPHSVGDSWETTLRKYLDRANAVPIGTGRS
jgi:N-6 DNA Methylase